MKPKFYESLYTSYGQFFDIKEILFESRTEHQELVIFENEAFGRVMALDGIIQTTEKDEFIYHEMMVHVPLFSHPNPQNVLIVGGGDGGILREVLKHKNVKAVTQVEIDLAVIDMAKKYLPNHSQGAFEDSRAKIVIDDGLNYVRECQQKYDVIISDSTDPVGPGEALFSSNFYDYCSRCLTPDGIFVAQNGVAYMQLDEVVTSKQRLKRVFMDSHFYSAAIPTYIGGIMTFAWASNNPKIRQFESQAIQQRFRYSGIKTKFYNPNVHISAFALPQYILDVIE